MKKRLGLLLAVTLAMIGMFSTVAQAEMAVAEEPAYEEIVEFNCETGTSRVLQVPTTLPEGDPGISPGSMGTAPILPEISPSSIIDGDNRYTVKNIDQPPYRFIGELTSIFENYSKRGTAFLVGPNMVLTTAEMLYDPVYGKVKEGFFTPAYDDDSTVTTAPYGGASFTFSYVSQNYINDMTEGKAPKTEHKYGIVRLDNQIGISTGYFGLNAIGDLPEGETAGNFTLAGYDENWQMRKQPGDITSRDGGVIHYRIDTSRNQLGGPIYYTQASPDGYLLIGINVEENGSYNSGRVITEALYNTIQKYS